MTREQIINEISAKFNEMGILHQLGNGTDILANAEFLDAKWSTGSKKINYESAILVDQNSNTIYMYELTKETGQGFSFGSDSESSFQSGTTLFRKVKSVKYGSDGKVYEIELDLGAIPKSVKEIAKKYGWSYKTVLKKEKAMWPTSSAQSYQQPQ